MSETTETKAARKGSISVNTSDILPIIKKWLYSEHDIFLRELVSNGCDAITKRATLGRIKNLEIPAGQVTVEIDKEAKVLRIRDNGIGMTEEEVEKYIAKLAFSGAQEFVEQMKKQGAETKDDIIGKFGLGFYSVFMVSHKVEVESLSMEEGAQAVKWVCEGDTEFTFETSDRSEVGTTITAHINDDSLDFLEQYKVQSVLRRYCDFMPYPVVVKNDDKEETINSTTPIWKKDPTSLKDEDYLEFYRAQYPMDPDPLFWIHLKVDHPFNLLGVLYFPKLNPNKPIHEQNIRLYAKQVFVSDNVKDIIPEFLRLLKGHIDSSDIPLNVSRSSLQGDPNVTKISNYIIKKVSESLKKLFKNDREKYEKIWEDVGLFVKYGCVSDTKFDEIMRGMVLFKTNEGSFVTFEEYHQKTPVQYQEKLKEKVLYYEKGKVDSGLIGQLKEDGILALETDIIIDPHFMQHVEMKSTEGQAKIKFCTVSSEIEHLLSEEGSEEMQGKVKSLFEEFFAEEKDKTEIEVKSIKNAKAPAYFKFDEYMKRLQHMTRTMGNGMQDLPMKGTLVVNPNNPLVQNALKIWEKGEKKDLAKHLCEHIRDLAVISSEGMKTHEEKDAFVLRSQNLIQELTNYVL